MRIVLALKNIEYSYQGINIVNGENLTLDYLQKNPLGQVPALVTPTISLTQSLAIIQYLEAVHPLPSLIPSSPYQLGKMWEICEIINSGIQPIQNNHILNKIESFGQNKKEWAQAVITEGLQSVENILKTTAGLYCIGDAVSIADVCLVPQVYNSLRFDLDINNFPIIKRVYESLLSLSAFQTSHPSNQPDAVEGS